MPGTGPQLLGNLRQVDALLAVLGGYSPGADPDADLETLRLELLVADRDHVERRLERVESRRNRATPRSAPRPDALRSVWLTSTRRPLSDWPGGLAAGLEPLTTMPLVALVNGSAGIDLALEAELAELPDDEALAFRDGPSALDEVVRRLKDVLGLITFFTASDKETRAWTLRQGQTALEAAASVHTDIARGFIRCEVVRWDDLVEAGSAAEAARRGLQRLEGKSYVVQDGDVLNVRFNV